MEVTEFTDFYNAEIVRCTKITKNNNVLLSIGKVIAKSDKIVVLDDGKTINFCRVTGGFIVKYNGTHSLYQLKISLFGSHVFFKFRRGNKVFIPEILQETCGISEVLYRSERYVVCRQCSSCSNRHFIMNHHTAISHYPERQRWYREINGFLFFADGAPIDFKVCIGPDDGREDVIGSQFTNTYSWISTPFPNYQPERLQIVLVMLQAFRRTLRGLKIPGFIWRKIISFMSESY